MFSNIMRHSGAACNFPALCGNIAGTGECLEDKASSVHRSVWRSWTDPAAPSGTPGLRGFPPRAAGVQNWFHMWALDRTRPAGDDSQRVQKSLIQTVDQVIDQLLGGQKTPSSSSSFSHTQTHSFTDLLNPPHPPHPPHPPPTSTGGGGYLYVNVPGLPTQTGL